MKIKIPTLASLTCWNSMNLFSKSFQRLETTPIMWDNANKMFRSYTDYQSLKYWLFQNIFAFIFKFLAIIFVVREVFVADTGVSTLKLIVLSVHAQLALFYLNMFWIQYCYSEDFVEGWNGLQKLAVEAHLELDVKENAPGPDPNSKPDILGAMLYYCVWSMTSFVPMLTLFTFYLEMDGVALLLDCFGPLNFTTRVILQCIRFWILFVSFGECGRAFQLVYSVIILGIKVCYRIFSYINFERGFSARKHLYYLKVQRSFNRCIRFYEIVTGLMYSCFLGLTVLYICITLKCFDLMPISCYLFFPLVTFQVVMFCRNTIPYYLGVNNVTNAMIAEWKLSVGLNKQRVKRSVMIREVRALQPLKWYIGAGLGEYRFLYFQKETQVNYFMTIIEYTIALLLAWPIA